MIDRISSLCILLALLLATSVVPAVSAAQGGTVSTEIQCDFPGEMIEAGDTAVFDLAVTNQGATGTCLL
ncbi:MAG: hypothetical protein WC093_09735, partial [Methanoculleus sp.]